MPLLLPRPGKWDCTATTNPSAAIMPNGTTYMIYKSRAGDGATLQLGITRAPHPNGPYERLQDEPIFQFADPTWHVEDPYLWHDGNTGLFHVVMKDDYKSEPSFHPGHGITGEWGAGVHAVSPDCLHWDIQGKAFTRQIRWDDGAVSTAANLERPNLLIENGRPTHLFAAIGEGSRPWAFTRTWNICVPLGTEPKSRDQHEHSNP